jgi:hypothetical protein
MRIAYVYRRETKADADMANVLTMEEARRMASNIAKLPTLLEWPCVLAKGHFSDEDDAETTTGMYLSSQWSLKFSAAG